MKSHPNACHDETRMYPHPEDCTKFTRCVNKRLVTFSCPPFTAFDPETQICAWRVGKNGCGGKLSFSSAQWLPTTLWEDEINEETEEIVPYMADVDLKQADKLTDGQKATTSELHTTFASDVKSNVMETLQNNNILDSDNTTPDSNMESGFNDEEKNMYTYSYYQDSNKNASRSEIIVTKDDNIYEPNISQAKGYSKVITSSPDTDITNSVVNNVKDFNRDNNTDADARQYILSDVEKHQEIFTDTVQPFVLESHNKSSIMENADFVNHSSSNKTANFKHQTTINHNNNNITIAGLGLGDTLSDSSANISLTSLSTPSYLVEAKPIDTNTSKNGESESVHKVTEEYSFISPEIFNTTSQVISQSTILGINLMSDAQDHNSTLNEIQSVSNKTSNGKLGKATDKSSPSLEYSGYFLNSSSVIKTRFNDTEDNLSDLIDNVVNDTNITGITGSTGHGLEYLTSNRSNNDNYHHQNVDTFGRSLEKTGSYTPQDDTREDHDWSQADVQVSTKLPQEIDRVTSDPPGLYTTNMDGFFGYLRPVPYFRALGNWPIRTLSDNSQLVEMHSNKSLHEDIKNKTDQSNLYSQPTSAAAVRAKYSATDKSREPEIHAQMTKLEEQAEISQRKSKPFSVDIITENSTHANSAKTPGGIVTDSHTYKTGPNVFEESDKLNNTANTSSSAQPAELFIRLPLRPKPSQNKSASKNESESSLIYVKDLPKSGPRPFIFDGLITPKRRVSLSSESNGSVKSAKYKSISDYKTQLDGNEKNQKLPKNSRRHLSPRPLYVKLYNFRKNVPMSFDSEDTSSGVLIPRQRWYDILRKRQRSRYTRRGGQKSNLSSDVLDHVNRRLRKQNRRSSDTEENIKNSRLQFEPKVSTQNDQNMHKPRYANDKYEETKPSKKISSSYFQSSDLKTRTQSYKPAEGKGSDVKHQNLDQGKAAPPIVSFKSAPYMVKGIKKPFQCPTTDGHFADPDNCAVFYHCDNGVAYRR
ncbi:hypothetical protein ElyMa_004312900 [Elysia marginata]|uniref:Chitin-binding type-2 domain-containing protein n=1 Tax=Elysia marginata TaxID=1093978 RepID=A0AAV4H043_9GAST|nr:hypothetical protein ElyMa_004312900 [Elysia marginata]